MNEAQRIALLNSQTACALITVAGMLVHDLNRIQNFGGSGIYVEEAYEAVINQHNIHWNGSIGTLQGR